MPELAEVEFYRKKWDPGLGRPVRKVLIHPGARVFRGTDTAALGRLLTGTRLLASHVHGKQMLFQFDRAWLGVHLGMTGEMAAADPGYHPLAHDHLVLHLDRTSLVFRDPRMFGRVTLHPGREVPPFWRNLPPSVTSAAFTFPSVARFLQRRSRTPVKAVLLMQEQFPGIGNWMADEILWRAGIHPSTHAGRIDPEGQKKIWLETRRVARLALKVIGTDWSDPPDTWLFNHRWKDGGICPRDGTPLRRKEIGGRTTCWCPVCQPR